MVRDANKQGWFEVMAADQPVVVMKPGKPDGAKGLTGSVSTLFTPSNGMTDYYETKSQPITRLMVWQSYISRKSRTAILEKFRSMHLHKKRGNIECLSKLLTPIVRGLMNYYCKFWTGHTHEIWYRLNIRLLKWVRWEKDLSIRAALKYLRTKYKEQPGLFPHWQLVHP